MGGTRVFSVLGRGSPIGNGSWRYPGQERLLVGGAPAGAGPWKGAPAGAGPWRGVSTGAGRRAER